MTLTLIGLLILSTVPQNLLPEQHVDDIEINHFYDDNGRLVFDQYIFYNWSNEFNMQKCVGWRLIKAPNRKTDKELLDKIANDPKYPFPYVDKWWPVEFPHNGSLIIASSTAYGNVPIQGAGDMTKIVYKNPPYETWTQYDPELINREFFHKENRPDPWLAKPLNKKPNPYNITIPQP